jgi:hypothetical protein
MYFRRTPPLQVPPTGWIYVNEDVATFSRYAPEFPAIPHLPHSILVLISGTFAFVPWLPWWSTRFSVRTLLIVTTLVAVVLGFGVYLLR